MFNVICMKWGTAYGPEYVNRLRAMVGRHLSLPFRFVCSTDDPSGIGPGVEIRPLPDFHVPEARQRSPWRKVSVFAENFCGLSGKCLFLDLDVVVTGPLDEIATYTNRIGIAENWTQPGKGIGNSSVFTFEIGKFAYIVRRYEETVETLFDRFPNSQTFVSRTAAERGDLHFFPRAWVRSFKVNCLPGGPLNWLLTPRLPEDARIIAFHGHPKPHEAIMGDWARARWPAKLYKHVRPTPWVKEHWG